MRIKRTSPHCGRRRFGAWLLACTALVLASSTLAEELSSFPDLADIELTLEQAIELSLRHNPELQALETEAAATVESAAQAGRGPNPELGLEVENFAGSGTRHGFSATETTLSLAQTFELGGRRARAREAAGWDVEMVRWEIELTSAEISARTTRAFVEILAAKRELEFARSLLQLAEQDLEFVERMVRSGAVAPVAINRARVAVSYAGLEIDEADNKRRAARLQLAALWNLSDPTFPEVQGTLESCPEIPTWETLQGQLDEGPRMRQWDVEADRRRAALALARARGSIDLTASAGLRHNRENGDRAVVAAVTIPLPVRDRNQNGQIAARLRLDKVAAERRADTQGLTGRLAVQHTRLMTAHDQVETLVADILPVAKESVTQIDESYRKGLSTLTDVLAVKQTWFELSLRLIDAMKTEHLAAVDIDLILGAVRTDRLDYQESD